MASKIELAMPNEVESFISEIRRTDGEPYLVPTPNWNQYIVKNARWNQYIVKKARCSANLPPFIEAGTHVVTERYQFKRLVQRLGNIEFNSQRLLTNIGAVWGAVKLEEIKPPPKGDIFDYGLRQPGSFRSNG